MSENSLFIPTKLFGKSEIMSTVFLKGRKERSFVSGRLHFGGILALGR